MRQNGSAGLSDSAHVLVGDWLYDFRPLLPERRLSIAYVSHDQRHAGGPGSILFPPAAARPASRAPRTICLRLKPTH